MAQIKTNLAYGVTGTIPTANIADDAITAAKIADNAVVTAAINADAITAAKVADDVINSEHLVDGGVDNAHLATGIASSKLTGALPAISGASLTTLNATNISSGTLNAARYTAGGITHTSSWNMNTPFEGPAAPIASNWGETWTNDMNDAAVGLGTNSVTESSGIFSFAVTGIWEVNFHIMISDNSSASHNSQGEIWITTNNSTWVRSIRRPAGLSAANMYNSTTMSSFLDVTDVANDKVRFHADMPGSNADVYGLGTYMGTYVLFKRLGDT